MLVRVLLLSKAVGVFGSVDDERADGNVAEETEKDASGRAAWRVGRVAYVVAAFSARTQRGCLM